MSRLQESSEGPALSDRASAATRPLSFSLVRTPMSGFAGTRHATALIAHIDRAEQAFEAMQHCRANGLTVSLRGGGCSFGDSYLNDNGVVLDLTRLNRIESWDVAKGLLCVEAGASIAEILACTLPDGWVLPAIPGSLTVTVAGAIANNVHGKDSCCYGNFGLCVRRISMLTARGDRLELSREETSELFCAVIGGMGLLGIILSAELQLVKIPSQTLEIETRIARTMAELVADIEMSAERGYGQAWIDSFPRGAALGRGFTKLGRFVGEGGSPPDRARVEKSIVVNTRLLGVLPARRTWRLARPLFTPPMMALVNWAYYRKAALEVQARGRVRKQLFTNFYFFHNNIPDFYCVYNPPGFAEIQCLFPRANSVEAASGLLALSQRLGLHPVLSGMKRHRGDDFMISFAAEGCAISLDFPLRGREPAEFEKAMRQLFEYAAERGGKVNLAKDAHLPRDLFRTMYPRCGEFWSLKQRLDPNHLFMSDIARRLLA
jgi:decaprenylphospho-beta-D-ribofuranose 2-oxidase